MAGMSIKGGRKNLGTVVELAETGEDCTSPLIPNTASTTTATTATKSITENSGDHVVIEIPTNPTDDSSDEELRYRVPEAETRTYKYPKDIEQLYEQRYGHSYVTEVPHQPRRNFLSQSRINLLSFINNVASPMRGVTRGKRSALNGSNLPLSTTIVHQTITPLDTGRLENGADDFEITPLNDELDWNMAPSDAETAERHRTSGKILEG
jgi:hypothetical protein